MFTILTACWVCAAPVPKPRHSTPVAVVTAQSPTAQAGETLAFTASVKNPSKEPFTLKRWADEAGDDDIVCELKTLRDAEYTRLYATSQLYTVTDCALRLKPRTHQEVPPGQEYRRHLQIKLGGQNDVPGGEYQFRVRVPLTDGELVSEPVVLKVTVPEKNVAAALEKLDQPYHTHPLVAANAKFDAPLLRKVSDDLRGTPTGNAITIRLLACDLHGANTPQDLRAALKAIDDRRKVLNELERELLDLSACRVLLNNQKVAKADEIIRRIGHPSTELDHCMFRLADLKRFVK